MKTGVAAQRVDVVRLQGGIFAQATGAAYRQREAKLQPAGRSVKSGRLTSDGPQPGVAGVLYLGDGFKQRLRIRVRMLANKSRVADFSTIRPAYITAISSALPATTPRSCVMRIMAFFDRLEARPASQGFAFGLSRPRRLSARRR